MSIPKPSNLSYADVTPKSVYMNRREVLRAMGVAGTVTLGGKLLSRVFAPETAVYAGTKLDVASKSPFSTSEKPTSYQDVTHYNNFYEFGTAKSDPAKYAQNFRTSPWKLSIEGEVKKPMKLTMDDVLKIAATRGAHLPASLRGDVVHRGALDRILFQRAHESRSANREGQVRRV